jgi:hypothetical protein
MIAGLAPKPLLFFANLGYPNMATYNCDGFFQVKDSYANSINAPKIMFISGSNTLFGVDTEKIEKEFRIPTVNYGVAAPLHFYIFHRAKKYIHSGDTVILPLEYDFYDDDKMNPSLGYVAYIAGYDPAFFYDMSFVDKIIFIKSMNIQTLIKITWKRIILAENEDDEHYDRKYLNKNGDMTYNPVAKKKDLTTYMGEMFPNDSISSDAQKELEDFISYCHQSNITVYAAWPNLLHGEKKFSDKDLGRIHAIEAFYRENDVEILGNYNDCIYDAELFYDSCYHLNEEGKRIHTDYLIRLLKEKLNR